MSKTRIPDTTKLLLFGDSAGRCEYRGCNKLLGVDGLTRRPSNLSAFAHIVADEPGGPRGHKTDSVRLAKDPSNLMVLCLEHHRLIDDPAQEASHSTEVLRAMKAKHEDRIRRLTAIQSEATTVLVLMEANIGPRKGIVSEAQATEAVLPRYPTRDPIWIDLARLSIEDGKPVAWALGMEEIDAAIASVVRPAVQRATTKHVSVFALGPIPLLMYLGRAIGDIGSGGAYQRHRDSEDWRWKDPEPDDPPFEVVRPEGFEGDHVALRLSLSGNVHPEEALAAEPRVGGAQYEIRLSTPRTDSVRTREQVTEFRSLVRGLLAEIRERHGPQVIVHLFPAVPNSIAVEFGRCVLLKADPRIEAYDLNWKTRSFTHALTLCEGGRAG